MHPNQFRCFLLLCSVLCLSGGQAQRDSSFTPNRRGFFVGGDYIYNYCRSVTLPADPGLVAGIRPADSLFGYTRRDRSTHSFGIHAGYNIPFLEKWSVSLGLEIDQRRELTEYPSYEGLKVTLKPLYYTVTRYQVVVPVRLNYYTGRFMISLGNNLGHATARTERTRYADGSSSKVQFTDPYIVVVFRESVSFRLLKKQGLYLRLTAEQDPDFYRKYGYNNAFMAGASYYF